MSTAVGIECGGGAVLAVDRLLVREGTVLSRSREHLFAFGAVGAAAVGSPGGLDAFESDLDARLRAYRTERGEPSLDAVERIVSDVAGVAGVDAVLAARDGEGAARIRAVRSDGSAFGDPVAAVGSGSELALGMLEGADGSASLADCEAFARGVIDAVAERDPATGGEADVWSLADGDPGGRGAGG